MLTGKEIEKLARAGDILLDPLDSQNIGPNSYDLRLGNAMARVVSNDWGRINTRLPGKVKPIKLKKSRLGKYFLLLPGQVYLGHTVEIIGSDNYVGIIHGRSSVARHGAMTHLTAGFCDLGWRGQVVLELANLTPYPMMLFPGDRVCQVEFDSVDGSIKRYSSTYQGQLGIKPAKGIGD